ncbi:MAG: fasciclin domain-containing protein [Phenylobacterium sp.]
MPFHRLLTAAAAVSLIAGVAAAQTPAPAAAATVAAPTNPAPVPLAKPLVANGDSMATLRQNGQFTSLVKALDGANLSALFQDSARHLTLFAPTDAAFAALPAGQIDKMIADPTKADLRKLLLHHVINAVVPSSKIKGTRGPWPTGAGDHVVLDGSTDGVLKADNAFIVQPDVTTSNGTIQVVDEVMIAGSVPEANPTPAPEPEPAAAAPAPAPTPAAKPPAKKKK